VKTRILIPVVVIALVAVAVYAWSHFYYGQTDSDGLTLYGNVDIREVRLAFNGSEHVGNIKVDEGDRVIAGQLLATLHTERLQALFDQARAATAAARATEHAAKLDYRRIRDLAKRNLSSEQDSDLAEAKFRVAQAQVDAAVASQAGAELALKDAELYAPEAGVIRERLVQPGDFVTPQSPVLTLALTDPVWIRSYLPETLLGQIKLGTPASIQTDSYPGKTYDGWVGFISPTAEFTPKNVETPELRSRLVYQIRVYACNPEDELRLGMPATLQLFPDRAMEMDTDPVHHCNPMTSTTP
jgi:HlyD family secretion protein